MKAIASIVEYVLSAFKHNPRYLIVLAAVLMPLSMFYFMSQITDAQPVVIFAFSTIAISVLAYTAWIVAKVLGHQERE
ncbi:hypothetical protein [Pseudomonas putida]|uniref:hypothetical protein n=1 Tax=Pseudomonas putida TaxID=303 RepID=UPI002270416B|nr:hypothetical protein [Pseudomonas putida]MDD2147424.1 hypothetical protein [Pseudomonas putida]HDS1705762.1 hypothetical protein [Pseudomonas putida]